MYKPNKLNPLPEKINKKTSLIAIILFSVIFLGVLGFKRYSPKKIESPLGKAFNILLGTGPANSKSSHIIYGFLPYWVIDKSNYIQTDKLTDIAYFALSIEKNGEIKKYNKDGKIDPGYNTWKNNKKLDNLIKKAQKAKTRVALTVISHDDDTTEEFLDCRDCWDTLADELIKEMESKNIKDLNVDFELVEPNAKEGLSLKYSQLVNFLNARLDKNFGNSFVVTSTLPDSMYKPRLTHIESLSSASDALFIMAYDFHRPNSENAGPIAPISGAGESYEYDIITMLNDYLSVSEPNKLILGVPYYGNNWLVESSSSNSERVEGNDILGYSITQTYEHIMDVKIENNLKDIWDSKAKAPYLTYTDSEKNTQRQIYYENADSLKIKYSLAKDKNLAGIGIWALGYDGGYQELWNLLKKEFY